MSEASDKLIESQRAMIVTLAKDSLELRAQVEALRQLVIEANWAPECPWCGQPFDGLMRPRKHKPERPARPYLGMEEEPAKGEPHR